MQIPVLQGIIDRRILANFRIDPEVMSRLLPAPFRPSLTHGYAIGGVCLIRLKQLRPRCLPGSWGLRSENAAHRFAVEWDVDGQTQQGVFINRRDSDSCLNALAGGRLFPGVHHRARFDVTESPERVSVAMQSLDGVTAISVAGTVTDRLPADSVFASVQEASDFFERGALGYSISNEQGRYDGLELDCRNWHAEPLEVETIHSSYFADPELFPAGSVEFDCALLMRGIHHEWHSREDICCPAEMPA
jgi:hypothetical protein